MYNANIINLIHHLSLHQKIILYSASLQTVFFFFFFEINEKKKNQKKKIGRRH